jgi:hypothetical protein
MMLESLVVSLVEHQGKMSDCYELVTLLYTETSDQI